MKVTKANITKTLKASGVEASESGKIAATKATGWTTGFTVSTDSIGNFRLTHYGNTTENAISKYAEVLKAAGIACDVYPSHISIENPNA